MNIGLLDVDYSHFPNFALMRASAWHKEQGSNVEWAQGGIFKTHYDAIIASKIFTFTPDVNLTDYSFDQLYRGGTGYDVHSRLDERIDNSKLMDYSIYPNCDFSVQFFSRGCIRHCPFCIVRDKEGYINPVEPVNLNPKGKWIEVLDNNFFANPEWKSSVDYLIKLGQPVNLHGVDVRIMNEEQAYWLNKMKLKHNIHIAWDMPQIDLKDKLKEVTKYIKPYKLTCYILVGFNSTPEQDLYRLNTLKELRITPFVQPYRDFENMRIPTQYEKDLARWANRTWFFKSSRFEDFEFRVGFKGIKYLNKSVSL